LTKFRSRKVEMARRSLASRKLTELGHTSDIDWDGQSGWNQFDSGFTFRDHLEPSLEFLECTLRMYNNTKITSQDLEWYKRRVEMIFHAFGIEEK
jgi:hypothetical protein